MRESHWSEAKSLDAGAALARAVSLHLEGRGQEALAELNRIAAVKDSAREVYAAKGHIEFELELYQDAARSYESLLAADPGSNSGYFNLAVCQEKLGRWNEAASNFQRALGTAPERNDARLGMGICLLHARDPENALECFDTCLRKNQADEPAQFGKAVALDLLGRQDEALVLYRQIVESNPAAEEPLANMVHLGVRRGDAALTRETSEKLLALRPFSQAALEGLAWCAFAGEDYEAAARFTAKLVEQTPEHFERRFNLGVAYQKLDKLDQAEKAYSEAARIKPEHAQTWANLGVVRQAMGNTKGAREAYESALRLKAESPEILANLAGLLEEQGRKSDAEEMYGKLIESNPGWEDAWFRLGYLKLTRGDAAGAIEAFERALEKRPDWVEANVNLGLAYKQIAETDEAVAHFSAALAAKPDSVDALRGLASIAVERQDQARALELQSKLIDLGERTPELFYNTGLLLQKQGQTEDAVSLYREALALRQHFPEALLNLGHALKSQGRAEEAKTCWRQALELKPELARGYFGG